MSDNNARPTPIMPFASWVVYGVVGIITIGLLLYRWAEPSTTSDINDFVRTMAGLVGGAALVTGLWFTHQTVENSRRTLAHQQESQKAERFFKASEQLGVNSEDAKIAALYSLERLSKDSPDYYDQVIDVISTFIRRRSEDVKVDPSIDPMQLWGNENPRPRTSHDIATAMTILSRREKHLGVGEAKGLDLRGANLCGLDINDADFQAAEFGGAKLVATSFNKCNLARASFVGAVLDHAQMSNTLLSGADFSGAQFRKGMMYWQPKLPDPNYLKALESISGHPFHSKSYGPPAMSGAAPLVDSGQYLGVSYWGASKLDGTYVGCDDLRGMSELTVHQWKSLDIRDGVLRPQLYDEDRNVIITQNPDKVASDEQALRQSGEPVFDEVEPESHNG